MVKCIGCGDVIGVWEPMIFLVESDARETSLLALGHHEREAADYYHRACYLGRGFADHGAASASYRG